MNQSENINELAGALSKAQGQMQPVYKDKKVAFKDVKYKYADLAAVWDSCRKPLSDNGLAIVQTMEPSGTSWVISTILTHSSGQWMKSILPINVNGTPSAMGSSISYMRRYALCAMVSISPEDDDGQEANKEYENRNNPPEPPKKNVPQMNQSLAQVINHDQFKQLSELMCKLDENNQNAFSAWYQNEFKCSKMLDIPQNAFDSCMRALTVKIKFVQDQDRMVG